MGNQNIKNCLVLGGTGYVGEQVCQCLTDNGFSVAFTYYRNQNKALSMEKEIPNCKAYQMSGEDFEAVQALISQIYKDHGKIDALVQCMGVEDYHSYDTVAVNFLDIDQATFQNTLQTTVQSTFAACQAFAQQKADIKGGNIVILGSTTGVKILPSPVHYAAAGGALSAMTKSLAKELGQFNICVNHIAIGILENGASEYLNAVTKKEYLKHACLGRFGTAKEIAEQVLWYVAENDYITGRTVCLDGGL